MKVAGVVVSGGNAKRLEGEKPFRRFGKGYLIENVLKVLVEMEIPFAVVFKHMGHLQRDYIPKIKYLIKRYRQRITWDVVYDRGPLVGILSGMRVVEGDWILVLPCDTPFIDRRSLENLLAYIDTGESNSHSCIVPRHEDGHIEPLFSLYRRTSLSILEKLLKSRRNVPIRELIYRLNPLYIPAEKIDKSKKVFTNINTLDDLRRVTRD
ncbi:MAG TPA: molybdenum cofactor guanylyltransferase [Methanothermococcus okinawensis]|uniref:Probable molybdenum cofactor guanylyltransferase n=1 Tax=Methanothermococcus okinawensis TaxID=155863 RepID=A0A833E455_9EURY|nr:molybdenum cofactor guanylyltransferase [Methanothermococcus okinawensis]HIP91325.1 molybdenum cofactor guanylyltransferase [Methanothermococcus okinawensis]